MLKNENAAQPQAASSVISLQNNYSAPEVNSKPDGDNLSLLRHSSLKLAKTWQENGKIKPYDNAKYFTHIESHVRNIRDLSALLSRIETDSHTCLVRGRYVGDSAAQSSDPEHKPGKVRRFSAIFRDDPLHTTLIEVDVFQPTVGDPVINPGACIEEYIRSKLPSCFHGKSYHWQLSNSAGHEAKKGLLKVHLWFWLSTPYTSVQLKAWAKANNIECDHSVFNLVQVHYTAAPVFEAAIADPVPKRSGFVEGANDEVDLDISDPTPPPRQVSNHPTMIYTNPKESEIAAALDYIDSDHYQTFIAVGMCLKDQLGERGFSIWNRWAATSPKHKPQEMQYKWNSFRGAGLTIATLFQYAYDAGYTTPPPADRLAPVLEDFVINGRRTGTGEVASTPQAPELPAASSASAKPQPEKQTSGAAFPAELLNAPGLVGMIEALINKTSIIRQPILALGAAIAAAGAIMGRKVRSDTNLRTNFYIIVLAPSGSGKDHARQVIKRILHEAGLGELELGVPASSAGLLSGIRSGNGRGVILWDEFGRVLQQISSWKSGSHEKDIITALVELFSSAQSVYQGKQYANHDGKNPLKPIDQPCLSVYGTSVPTRFYESLSSGEAIDGFLARWIIFEIKDYPLEEEEHEDNLIEVPQALIDECKRWKEHPDYTGDGSGNLVDVKILPRLIKASSEAKAHLKNFATENRKKARAYESIGNNAQSAIWSRAAEHARKLALVAHEGDQIEMKSAEWAVKLARYCCEYTATAVADYVSSTPLQAATKKMLLYIRSSTTGRSLSAIGKKFEDIPKRMREEILKSLMEREDIMEDKISGTGGRPKMTYHAVRRDQL